LTIIPGLRFELEDGLVEKHNQMIVGWNPTASLPDISGPANTAYATTLASATAAEKAVLPTSLTIQGGPLFAGVNGAPRTGYANSYRVMPRFGGTYQASRRVVIRAGFGLYFDTMNALSAEDNQSGFSASTSQNSSTNFGASFTAPLSNPFPASSSGANFNSPTGSAAGAMQFLGSGATVYDHAITPAREYRGSIGTQIQFSRSTVLDISYNIARTYHILMGKNDAYTPASFYIGGQQPNTATSTLLGQLLPNPFYIGNFSGVAASNPAAYSLMSHASYYTSSTISLGNLIRAYPQMTGFTEEEPLGSSNFQEFLFHLTRRWAHGVSLTASLEVNDQHDADYFANAYDPLPSWEPSNNSTPTRFTLEQVWILPFGRGNKWASQGWESRVFGGFQIASQYEAAPGLLIGFGNLFYQGTPKASQIKLKSPIWNMGNLALNGTANYIKWLNQGTVTAASTSSNGVTTCTYSGVGFVTNTSCQPNAYNELVFPTRIPGVRAMGVNFMNGSVSRTFHLAERMNLQTSVNVDNVFNHQQYSAPNTSPTSSSFTEVTSANVGLREITFQGRFTF
jgi:hypothetical protein